MAYFKDATPRTVHIKFSPEEVSRLKRRADDVGIQFPTFVRQMALTGKVKGYNLKPIREHTEAVGEVAAAVRDMVALPHPDRWAYEADIERIEDLLKQLLDSEQALISVMTRRLSR